MGSVTDEFLPLDRKYRPQTLDEVVGNVATVKAIKTILARPAKPHGRGRDRAPLRHGGFDMMDARSQAQAADRLDEAMRRAGIIVERGVVTGGNLERWVAVPAAAILGRLMALGGWRVRSVDPAKVPVIDIGSGR